MFLAVTPLEEFWDKNDELLFIGPWCALYERRPEWERLRHRFMPDPWSDPASMKAAAQYCRGVSGRLLDQLVPYLNETLAIARGRRAWRILLDPWLTYHVEQMYDHYVHVENALKLEPSLRTLRLDPACYETPQTTTDFIRLSLGHFFHLQMFSHILSAKIPASPVRRYAAPAAPSPATRWKTLAKSAGAWALTACTPPGAGEVLFGELGLRRGERLKLIFGSRFKALPYLAELPDSAAPAPVMDEQRRGLSRLQAQDEFERIFIDALPRHLPTVFLEGHAAAVGFTRSRLRRIPRAAFTTVDCHYTDSFKFAACECVERGAELWGYQHGGGYGMADYTPAEDFERSVNDRYYCWGWSQTENDPKLRDLPPPMLSRGGAARPGDSVFYVSTALDLHNIRLCINNTLAFDYLDRQARLLRCVPEPVRQQMQLRLHSVDFGWRHRERIRDLYPEAVFDDRSIPFGRRLRESRLAVFDCPSTPLLEAMAADIPSVLSWRKDAWPLRDSTRPFVSALRKAGILFESPEEAAAQIGRVYADPRAWWDEPQRRAAHRAFTKTFARSSADWLAAWLKEIREGLAAR